MNQLKKLLIAVDNYFYTDEESKAERALFYTTVALVPLLTLLFVWSIV